MTNRDYEMSGYGRVTECPLQDAMAIKMNDWLRVIGVWDVWRANCCNDDYWKFLSEFDSYQYMSLLKF